MDCYEELSFTIVSNMIADGALDVGVRGSGFYLHFCHMVFLA